MPSARFQRAARYNEQLTRPSHRTAISLKTRSSHRSRRITVRPVQGEKTKRKQITKKSPTDRTPVCLYLGCQLQVPFCCQVCEERRVWRTSTGTQATQTGRAQSSGSQPCSWRATVRPAGFHSDPDLAQNQQQISSSTKSLGVE